MLNTACFRQVAEAVAVAIVEGIHPQEKEAFWEAEVLVAEEELLTTKGATSGGGLL